MRLQAAAAGLRGECIQPAGKRNMDRADVMKCEQAAADCDSIL